jgi:hypothetical protein
MPINIPVRRGIVCRHHSGRVYTVLDVTNVDGVTGAPKETFPATVHYVGANGFTWSRPLSEFEQKFSVLFDGTQLAE